MAFYREECVLFYFVFMKLPLAQIQETNGRRLNCKQEAPLKVHYEASGYRDNGHLNHRDSCVRTIKKLMKYY